MGICMKKIILMMAMVATLLGCATSEKCDKAQPKHRNVAVQTYTFNSEKFFKESRDLFNREFITATLVEYMGEQQPMQ
ncbi:MAG: hypothetical protein J6K91_01755, partial [Opitutales bacterium]|nr:hypothetical protein [Opitutales bacterium]